MNTEKAIFKKGSTTFYTSSLFFPKSVKQDVFDLYSFVRVVDDYVDTIPAEKERFYHIRRLWDEPGLTPGNTIDDQVVKNMRRVAAKHHFEPKWTTAFLDAMQSDLVRKEYKTLDDTLGYIYGSAEVIGLMMSKIMGLDTDAAEAAQMQGRAMQMINFIRDINEDNMLNRQYFPASDFKKFGLKDITLLTAEKNSEAFHNFVHYQLARYKKWQQWAEDGYDYVPKRLRIPLKTASDMYDWTARQIEQDPKIIFTKKIKPSKKRVIRQIIINTCRILVTR